MKWENICYTDAPTPYLFKMKKNKKIVNFTYHEYKLKL